MISGATGAVAVVLVSLGIQVKASLFSEMLINSLAESGELSSYILQYILILLCAIMAGCPMIGQSIINFTNGGRGRLSSLTAAILLILFVVVLSGYILIYQSQC